MTMNTGQDDDDNENQIANILIQRRPRILRIRRNWLEIYDDVDFEKRFRLTKENTYIVLQKIEHKLRHDTERNNAIPPVIQLLVFLRFTATGSFILNVADYFGISKTSAEVIICNVSLAIANLHREYIKFPSEPDNILKNKVGNFNLSGFIRVIGAIDCIHVRIKSYGGTESELFRNRKGFYSINVQAIVNSSLQIIDLVSHWPGATHDATIFDNSRIKARFESGEFGNGILLADSGYPSLPYLLTPLQNPQTPAEILYNEAHTFMRTFQDFFDLVCTYHGLFIYYENTVLYKQHNKHKSIFISFI
ncbi:putative nuclease HARBI1 [Prorops nasuta]|uniref:putative nuclease HARBI1 n=1 Tax=Prorops nasuta TaxID=863751 RepID=UPI0034CEDD92